MATTRKRKFKTEVQQLLNIVIHSLYTKKEIFLRELISNSSDAIDRLRFEALQDKSLMGDDGEWKIKLIPDSEKKTLTVSDNGIGMSREEVEKNIGTIARSGTKAFLEELEKGNVQPDAELIGQFGVGFYASFMVADKVTLITRRAGEETGTKWESAGDGSYTLADYDKPTRGTDVIVHLTEETEEYLEEWRLRKIVKQYSDFVAYPVTMDVEREETPLDDDGKPIEGADKVKTVQEETLNSMKALWKRDRDMIEEKDYNEFYHHVSHDFTDPLEVIHFKAEGVTEFTALLFIPAKAPWNLFLREEQQGLHLYVRNVFITDDCKELMPEYLRFVKGVVDSSDLPLNVSRETLQDHAMVKRIRKSLVGKVLNTLTEMKEKEEEKYATFYAELGRVLKEGMHFDFQNKEKLQELLMFESSQLEAGKLTDLHSYVERMPEEQQDIYYLTGDSRQLVANSPYLETFESRGWEVLLLTDPIDEWVVQSLTEYDEKKLTAIDRGDLELDSEAEKEAKEEETKQRQEELGDLMGFMKEKLGEKVKEVRLSHRLTQSACCLVADEHGMNAHMERIFKAMNQEMPEVPRTLELNPKHPLVEVLHELYEQDKESAKLADYVELVYDQALLNEGSPIENPLRFTRLVSELMVQAKPAAE